jgi:hypothetical protein
MLEVAVAVPAGPAGTPVASPVTDASRPPPEPVVKLRRVRAGGTVHVRVVLDLSAQ